MSKIMSADIFRSLAGNVDIAALCEALYDINGVVECDGAGGLTESAGVAGFDTTAIHTDASGEIAALTTKADPVDGDLLVIEDSEATNAKKKMTLGNLSALLATIGDNVAAASAANEGQLRYTKTATMASIDISIQTGVGTYAWSSILFHDWT